MLTVLNGLSFGFILFLLASGLSLIMGAMGVLNLAHGALYMVGAYVGWSVAVDQDASFLLAVAAGAAAAGLVGLVMERGLFARLHDRLDEQILAAFGCLYILTDLVSLIWGPQAKAPIDVPALDGSVTIAGFSYPLVRVVIIGVGIAFAIGLWWLQERTRAGAIVRAGMDDSSMVRAIGINVELVVALLFVVGAAVAGAAGVIGGLVLGASTSFGIDVLLLALIVVVLGGVGSVGGALAGALMVGVVDTVSRTELPEVSSFTLYALMTVVLLLRPTGLSGKAA